MTNAVSNATDVVGQMSNAFNNQVSEGREMLDQLLSWLAQEGVGFALNVLGALLILFVGGLLVKMVVGMTRKALQKTNRVDPLLMSFLCSVVSKTGWAVLLVVALARVGVNVGPLVAGLGVTGVVLGFAFKESLGSLAAGLMIALNHPFKVGDYVIAGGTEGTVLELNMMATVLATADNKRVTVPNGTVWGGAITNFSALGKRRVDTVVGIAYGADINLAIETARAALQNVPGILPEPVPTVAVRSLDDSAVTLVVRPWSSTADYWSVHAGTQKAVKEAFDAAGISIPFPQLDVHTHA